MSFDSATLEADLAAVEAKLDGPPASDDLTKALADVASGALRVAEVSLKKAQAPAADEAEDDDAETDGWVQDLLHGDDEDATMQKSQETGKPGKKTAGKSGKAGKVSASRQALQKATAPEPEPPATVDFSAYFAEELTLREADREDVERLAKTQSLLLKSIVDLRKTILAQQQSADRVHSILAKSMLRLLSDIDVADQAPVTPSKFAAMEKAARAQGGTDATYTKDVAAKMLQAGKLTPGQHRIWKHTGLLPAGVTL